MLKDIFTKLFKQTGLNFSTERLIPFKCISGQGGIKELAWGGGSFSMILGPTDFPRLFSPREVQDATLGVMSRPGVGTHLLCC